MDPIQLSLKAWNSLLQTKHIVSMTLVIWLFKAFMEDTYD